MSLPKGFNGAVIYRGPSALDGDPIVVIATGLRGKATTNDKTGAMVQTWVLRADVEPMQAIHLGLDASICGDCPHRGRLENGRNVDRSCYVLAFQAPTSIYRAYERGRYFDVARAAVTDEHERVMIAALFADRKVRLGSYGDPAAVPAWVWQSVLKRASHWTGYTHQPDKRPDLAGVCMASADTASEARRLQRKGWRTFRVMTGAERPTRREVLCPASDESPASIRAEERGTDRPSCDRCGLCKGSAIAARSVAIYAHGTPGTKARANVRRGRSLVLAKQ